MPAVVASLAFSSVATTPVRAGGGDVAAGVIGDLAAGTIISGSRWTALLRSAAGICRASLLLDAWRAGMGWIPGCVDISDRQSLRVNRSARSRYAPASRTRTASANYAVLNREGRKSPC